MSSFLGQSIQVQLQGGDYVRGKITSVDAVTGSLGLLKLDGRFQSLSRGEIVDLQLLPEEATQPASDRQQAPASSSSSSLSTAPPRQPAFQDPAILSYNNATPSTYATTLQSGKSPAPIPTAPAAMLATRADEPRAAPAAKAKSKNKKSVAPLANVGTSSNVQTEEENSNEYGQKQASKNKKKAAKKAPVISSTEESDLEQDFDFDKALQSFDKRKIWQEIKTTDQTDPRSLLVSHNRINGPASQQDAGRFRGRNGQEKLGLHEPVLSPSPTASHASLPALDPPAVTVRGDSAKLEEELQRVRGNALQREMENSKLRDEIQRLADQVRVLTALGGVDLAWQADVADGRKWKGTVFESLSAHSEARRNPQEDGAAKGSLTFSLKTFSSDAGKLRYLGLVSDMSDPSVAERLPPQYTKEMGLKTESASVFVRRIKDAIQPK